ncbi:unnamed protein product [Musa hybrid cultivar]
MLVYYFYHGYSNNSEITYSIDWNNRDHFGHNDMLVILYLYLSSTFRHGMLLIDVFFPSSCWFIISIMGIETTEKLHTLLIGTTGSILATGYILLYILVILYLYLSSTFRFNLNNDGMLCILRCYLLIY